MTYTQIWDTITREPATDVIVSDVDKAFIPNDPLNGDWQQYQM